MRKIGFTVMTIFMALIVIINCTREYSCEGDCGGEDSMGTLPLVPPTKIPPRDSIFNELISHYSYDIEDNSAIRKQYFCFKTKYHPGHYTIADSIPIRSSVSSHYEGTFNIKNYPDFKNYDYVKGDTFPVFYEIRYRNGNTVQTDSATLIY